MIATLLAALALALPAAPPPAAQAAPPQPRGEPATLVLIVASNRGALPGRAPLTYADDDAAKYHRVLSAVAVEGGTELLTDFDRDTARLFPDLLEKAHSPTRAQLDAAAARLGHRAAELRRAGRPVRLYFVFAGHGDVDQGRGFLELADGAFTSDDLQALIAAVDAGETHVILDSCNSFYVVSPRRTGGVRLATPREAAEALARRLPNVGVFLSTSAQAEVYEWSDLQSGVFSHAVRSGLLGAADVDGDGRVTYEELAAFVETAVADIKNPLFRPTVFARGPNGDDARTILERPASAHAALVVEEPGPVRLAVRDLDGLRWLDAHQEGGAALRLWFPPSLEARLEVDRLRRSAPQAGEVESSYRFAPGPGPGRLADLPHAATAIAMRGPGEIFQALFARPFGPAALAGYQGRRTPALEQLTAMLAGEPRPAERVAAAGGIAQLAAAGAPAAAEPPYPGARPGFYLALRPGLVVPWVQLTGRGFGSTPADSSPSLLAAVGWQVHPWFGVELEAGYQQLHAGPTQLYYPYQGYYLNYITADVRGRSVPLAVNVRLQVPLINPRPYLLLGGGAAIEQFTLDPADYNATLRATRTVPHLQGGLGLELDLGDALFVGVDARYQLPARARAFDFAIVRQALRAGLDLGWRF